MKLIIICLFFMLGCSSTKMVDCYNLDNDGRHLLEKAKIEIKSYYLIVEEGDMELKKILQFECVNDSTIKIEVLSSWSVHGHFLMDEDLKIKSVYHSLPPVY